MIDQMRPSLSFVVPCFNEAANIADTVSEIKTATEIATISSYEIVIVDDCSKDLTASVVERLSVDDSRIVLIRNPVNLGFGGAYKQGIKNAHGNYVIMIPGDNAHPAHGIVPILTKAGEADIIIPYASNPEARPWLRRLTSRAFTALLNSLFRLNVPYYNGLVLHKLDLLRGIDIQTDGFAYQAEGLIKLLKAGASFSIVGVQISERKTGKSQAFRLKNIYRVLRTIWELRWEVHRTQNRSGKF
jgi:dolichol-phosphate mannosyltransferase